MAGPAMPAPPAAMTGPRPHNDQAIGPDFGQHDLSRGEWHHQQMLDRAVLALTDQGRTGEEHGDEGDAIDELHHGHEGGNVEIRIKLRPDDEGHAVGWRLSLVRRGRR